ncbi:hypothetical protein AURDEDRAFT_124839 [Auricularia subglabra TFB-10046 SS5]|nr:hypothetical protein AURDEDRAFT_124839 [Auricularia subglabra TFB-10046 SS5]
MQEMLMSQWSCLLRKTLSAACQYDYAGLHPAHYQPTDDLEPLILISLSRVGATAQFGSELDVRLKRRFSLTTDGRYTKAIGYLGGDKTSWKLGNKFYADVDQHLRHFPNSHIIVAVEAHCDAATGGIDLGGETCAAWGPDALFLKFNAREAKRSSLSRRVAQRSRSPRALNRSRRYYSDASGTASLILGAAGKSFVPTVSTQSLVDITFRVLAEPLVNIVAHMEAVYASNLVTTTKNQPIYVHLEGTDVHARTLHYSDRNSPWGFPVKACPRCGIKNTHASLGSSQRTQIAKSGICGRMHLKCFSEDPGHPPMRTEPVNKPEGVAPASAQGAKGKLVWHVFPFPSESAPKWEWPKEGTLKD